MDLPSQEMSLGFATALLVMMGKYMSNCEMYRKQVNEKERTTSAGLSRLYRYLLGPGDQGGEEQAPGLKGNPLPTNNQKLMLRSTTAAGNGAAS